MPDNRRKYYFNLEKITKDSHEKYYWLGFIAGDGSIREKENRLRIELKYDDIKHLEKFRDFLESNYPIFERHNNHGSHCAKIDINSADLRKYLAKYNIIQNKTENFVIPIEQIPVEYQYDYIRGFMDADGCICIRKDRNVPSLSFTAHKKECIEQIKQMLGLNNTISFLNNNYNIIKEGTEVIKILNKIYENSTEQTRLDRKYNIYCSLLK